MGVILPAGAAITAAVCAAAVHVVWPDAARIMSMLQACAVLRLHAHESVLVNPRPTLPPMASLPGSAPLFLLCWVASYGSSEFGLTLDFFCRRTSKWYVQQAVFYRVVVLINSTCKKKGGVYKKCAHSNQVSFVCAE